MRASARFLSASLAAALLASPAGAAEDGTGKGEFYGFDVSKATIPKHEIVSGGPGRDGIKAVDEPKFVTASVASWVGPTTQVLGVAVGEEARAYPVHLLDYHQIVNDEIGGKPVVVTWDPISGTPRAFERTVAGKTLTFGVSGLLHNANFLLYDRETESLWQQFDGLAVAGPLAGKTLTPLRIRQEVRDTWLSRFPDSRILERPDRMHIDYRYSPFERYWTANRIPFPVKAKDESYHAKEVVVGISTGGKSRAYLGSAVTAEGGHVEDEIGGEKVEIFYDPNSAVFRWEVPEGVDVVEAYWFAWKAHHPETDVYGSPGAAPEAASP